VANAKPKADAAKETVHGQADQAADRAYARWQSFKADTSAKMAELHEQIERKRDELVPGRPPRRPAAWRQAPHTVRCPGPRSWAALAGSHEHGDQLTATAPGRQSWPCWHASGYGHQSGRSPLTDPLEHVYE
jgi:hypothetical protein